MNTLTLKKRGRPPRPRPETEQEPHIPERALIQPHQIKELIEGLMACPVGFDSQRFYDPESKVWFTDFRFVNVGRWAQARVTDDDLALSLDEFRERIIAPMVARWRSARWAQVRR